MLNYQHSTIAFTSFCIGIIICNFVCSNQSFEDNKVSNHDEDSGKEEETVFQGVKRGLGIAGEIVGEGVGSAFQTIGGYMTPTPSPTGCGKVKEGLQEIVDKV